MGLITIIVLLSIYRTWKRWHANAYRRQALRELRSLDSVAEVSELLRRTALAIFPRQVVADMTGDRWAGWLNSQTAIEMSSTVREQLTHEVYGPASKSSDIREVRQYAASWIAGHRRPSADGGEKT